ncbi:hypothetical protein Q9L58_010871, partial [Maublancomyces gigas]
LEPLTMWKMVHDRNAIEMMTAALRFREAIPSLASKRILRAIEPAATFQGLINRQPIQSFQINFGTPNVQTPGQVLNGMVFQKTSLVKVGEQVVNQLASQVQFQPTEIVFNSWIYNSWEKEREDIRAILKDAISIAADAVAIANIRLEYVDRFIFDGENSAFTARGLLREDSDLVSPHIFSAPDLFHSHTGRFDDVTEISRTLYQVNIDAQDVNNHQVLGSRRSIATTTAVEVQYNQGLEIESKDAIDSYIASLDDLHSQVIDLFKKIIDVNFAKANGLPHE